MEIIKLMLIAGCGGFVGTCLRFLAGQIPQHFTKSIFPFATLTVNIIGCFAIGCLLGLAERSDILSSRQNALFIVGFCGGFTTFSTFANDIVNLYGKSGLGISLLYMLTSIVGGVLCVLAGRAVTSHLS